MKWWMWALALFGALALLGIVALVGAGFMIATGRMALPGALSSGPDPVPEVPLPQPFDRSQLSEPRDPWDVKAVPVKTMLVVLPMERDGRYCQDGVDAQLAVQHLLACAMPRDFGMARGSIVRGMIERMSIYEPEEFNTVDPNVVAAIKSWTGANHVLSGTVTLSEDGTQWTVDARLNSDGAGHTKTVQVPAGNDNELASLLAPWVMEKLGYTDLDEMARATLSNPTLGPNALSSKGDLALAMHKDARHEEWVRLAEAGPLTGAQRYSRLYAATSGGDAVDMAIVQEMDPGPLPEDAPLYQHFQRELILKAEEDHGALHHERALMMAKFPGYMSTPDTWIYSSFNDGQKRDEYLHAVREWQKRLPDSPHARAKLGDALATSAYDWRGTGWASSVSSRAWQMFQSLNVDSAAELEAAIAAAGSHEPWATSQLVTVYALLGDKVKMKETHEACLEDFPSQIETHSSVLHFLRPRWGGSHAEAMTFIDRSLRQQSDNPGAARLAFVYHGTEARSVPNIQDPRERINKYLKDNPDAKEQLERAMAQLRGPGAKRGDRAFVLTAATILKDSRAWIDVMREDPELDKWVANNTVADYYGDAMYNAAWASSSLGNWETLRRICEISHRDDKNYCSKGMHDYEIFQDEGRLAFAALATAMTGGDPAASVRTLESLTQDGGRIVSAHYIRLKHGLPLPENTVETLTKIANDDLEDPDALYLLAWVHTIQGRPGEAAEAFAKAEEVALKGNPWLVIQADVREVIGKTEVVAG